MSLATEPRLGDILGQALRKPELTCRLVRKAAVRKAVPRPIKKPLPVSRPWPPTTITNLAPDVDAARAEIWIIHPDNVLSRPRT